MSKQTKRERRKARRIAREGRNAPVVLTPAQDARPARQGISQELLARSRVKRGTVSALQAFAIPRPPKGVLPERLSPSKDPVLAMDEQAGDISVWAAGTYASGWFDGPLFMGYPALALLAALPEYRRMAEVLATECTRKWIRLAAGDGGDEAKAKMGKITALEAELKRLDVRGAMRRMVELDAFFGRSHLFIDVGADPDDREELVTSIGNGRNEASTTKFSGRKNFLRGVKPIEPVWCYPSRYNATNPLKDDWYAPQTWFCQGQEIHVTRLLRFIGREMPDLLKPAYMFGGISLSQLMKPYVDRWISVVQAVTDIIVSFSTSGVKTNLEAMLKPTGGGPDILERLEIFGNLRTNRGVMALDKDTEEFFQFNTPLSELEALMSKFQEHLCSISGEPVVKLLGIQPAGLNASSEGEITSWIDWVEAFREKFCAPHLTTIIDFAQLSLFGEVDPDITWTWENLQSLDAKEETERQKVEAETDGAYVEMGAFSPQEIRAVRMRNPESPYYGIDEIAPEGMEGAEGAGMVDPDMAAEFPQLEAPPATGAQPDATGQEDPRTAGRRGPGQPAQLPRSEASPARAERTSADPARTERLANPARAARTDRQRTREPEGAA